ncbi:MAG: DUF1365 domain-containing protein [uncultured Campylobacterales bacterium]|uniref:DUF1365 domain-containing protein n=1 Tax=uncultured Campylobacterales bacterium TaxID=352960 RepID=A0A6S6SZT0_9BACT|nr:MAG: DUF1365 domain-containing protein [uncultured Campylobacterales bacterium]
MSHYFLEGSIYHKRFVPLNNSFKYPFYMLDIDMSNVNSLKNKFFGKFRPLNFKAKDHFGDSNDFLQNVKDLVKKFDFFSTNDMRFLTLPRIMNFVFNPISILIIFKDKKPYQALVEVHNYNNGRVIYPLTLSEDKNGYFKCTTNKDMYVSPFFGYNGEYDFTFKYTKENIFIKIDLYEESTKKLVAIFESKKRAFNSKSSLIMFFKYPFITFGVVTKTLYQSIKLFFKKLKFYKPRDIDKVRRY